MEKKIFKKGDTVIRTYGDYNGMNKGDTDIVISNKNELLTLENFGGGHSDDNFKVINLKTQPPKNYERFMVYGTGCDNKSDLFKNDKDMKNYLKKCVNDSNWTGEIIGYKLTPLYKGEKNVKIINIKEIKPKAKPKAKKVKK